VRGRNRVPIVIDRLPLYRPVCAWPGRAVRIYDSFGEQIREALPALRSIGGEKMIEAPVLPDYDD
jgi:hypothetical protein